MNDLLIACEPPKESWHDDDADHRENDPVDHRQDNTLSRCPARFILFSGTSRCGDQSVDPHSETDGHGIDEILDRKYQRQRFHGILADPGNKITVYYIIEGIHQHGQDHGHSHSEEKRKDRLLLHESFIHDSNLPYNF